MRVLTRAFEELVKDKEIIAAEVMNEYNTGVRSTIFPRVRFCAVRVYWHVLSVIVVCVSAYKPCSQGCRCHDAPSGNSQPVGWIEMKRDFVHLWDFRKDICAAKCRTPFDLSPVYPDNIYISHFNIHRSFWTHFEPIYHHIATKKSGKHLFYVYVIFTLYS